MAYCYAWVGSYIEMVTIGFSMVLGLSLSKLIEVAQTYHVLIQSL